MNNQTIWRFQGQYRFLSNFWMAPQNIQTDRGRITFCCNEQYYVYCKCSNDEDRDKVLTLTKAGEIKHFGRTIKMVDNWDEMKVLIMFNGLDAKFNQNEDLKQWLIDTEYRSLVEGNGWGDTYWGVNLNPKRGELYYGKNMLGHILMSVRSKLIIYQ